MIDMQTRKNHIPRNLILLQLQIQNKVNDNMKDIVYIWQTFTRRKRKTLGYIKVLSSYPGYKHKTKVVSKK